MKSSFDLFSNLNCESNELEKQFENFGEPLNQFGSVGDRSNPFGNANEPSTAKKKLLQEDLWPKREAKWLLDKYTAYEKEVGRMQRFRSKIDLYRYLSCEHNSVFNTKKTAQQIANRVLTIHRQRNTANLRELTTDRPGVKSVAIGSIIDISPNACPSPSNGPPILGAASNFVRPSAIGMFRRSSLIGTATGVVKPTNNGKPIDVRWSSFQIRPPNFTSRIVQSSESANIAVSSINNGLSTVTDPSAGENGQSIGRSDLDLCRSTLLPQATRVLSNITSNTSGLSTISGSSTAVPAVGANFPSNKLRDLGSGTSTTFREATVLSTMTSNTGTSSSITGSSTITINGPYRASELRCIDIWSTEESKYMLDLYYLFMNQVGPMKYFRNKKAMWEFFAQKISFKFDTNKTGEQVSNRYKSILRSMKNAVDKNNVSGGIRHDVEFREELEKIAASDDSIEPEVLRGINYVRYKDKEGRKEPESKPRWDKPDKKGILNVLSETMQVIEKRRIDRDAVKEQERNERHKKVIELLGSLKKN